MICQGSALKVSHDKNKPCVQLVRAPISRTDRRTNVELSFNPQKRMGTRELRSWLQTGRIIPLVESVRAKAGPIDRDNAEAYLARDIICTGLSLDAFLDEFHPHPKVC